MRRRIQLALCKAFVVLLPAYCSDLRAQQAEAVSGLEFHSSNRSLDEVFQWAKQQALQYGREGSGTIGPWYEAALPGRNAFCMRDVSHQTEGAAALGLYEANHNMLRRFAISAEASRNWAAFWEIDGNGKPSSFDYVSDSDFWFNLPANFDLLDASVRMWRWTGDNSYRDYPNFRVFYRETLSDYLKQWQLQPSEILSRPRLLNREREKGKFVESRGIPSYTEGTKDFTVGVDLLAAEYRALRSYIQIASNPAERKFAASLQSAADQLQNIIDTIGWSSQERHYFGMLQGDQRGYGSGDTMVLYFNAARNPEHIKSALDHVANPSYWGRINIEEESYVPIVLFRGGRSADAYKVLFDLSRPDKPRRDYPEVSYASIAAIVTGAMGIEPSNAGDDFDLRTLARPLESTDELALRSLRIRSNVVDIVHKGKSTTSMSNRQGPVIRWRAEFAGKCGLMLVSGRRVHGIDELMADGTPLCSAKVTVPPGASRTLTLEQ